VINPTPTPGAAAELPVVAWLHELTTESYRESSITSFSETDPWVDALKDIGHAVLSRPLTPHAPAQSQLDALREEVARLTKERDEAQDAERQLSEQMDAVSNELAALKAQPTDIDALMALADEMAEWAGERFGSGFRHYESAREALRAKLAARKEPT
jgi:ABC-type hemin transport system substrate-binding protein